MLHHFYRQGKNIQVLNIKIDSLKPSNKRSGQFVLFKVSKCLTKLKVDVSCIIEASNILLDTSALIFYIFDSEEWGTGLVRNPNWLGAPSAGSCGNDKLFENMLWHRDGHTLSAEWLKRPGDGIMAFKCERIVLNLWRNKIQEVQIGAFQRPKWTEYLKTVWMRWRWNTTTRNNVTAWFMICLL